MNPLRILLVTHRFLPNYVAGTEVYTATLAQGLAQRGHTVQVFSGDPSARVPYAYEWQAVPVAAVPWGLGGRGGPVATFLAGFINPGVERRFASVCAEFKPDIVHVQHLMGLSPWLMAIGRRSGARVVVTLHDFWFVCSNTWLFRWNGMRCPGPGWGYHCGGCASQRLGWTPYPVLMAFAAPLFIARTYSLRVAQHYADHFIAPSRLSARIFVEQGGLPQKVTVLPHAVFVTHPRRQTTVSEPARPVRFIYVGSLIPPKGLHVALAAFNGLTDPRAQFHLYGDPLADPAYVRELREMVRHPGVAFKGTVAREAVQAVLQEADLLLMPSLWYESYSIIVDEALSAGVPVLVSDHSAPAERVIPEVNGLTAPPGDVSAWQRQLQRFADDPALRARLRRGVQPPLLLSQHLLKMEAVYIQR